MEKVRGGSGKFTFVAGCSKRVCMVRDARLRRAPHHEGALPDLILRSIAKAMRLEG
jgi:hypothetical protein